MWKLSFNFFDKLSSSRIELDQRSPTDANKITSICSGSRNVFLGRDDGRIFSLSSTFAVTRQWPAHETRPVTHLKHMKQASSIVSITEDLSGEPEMKVWSLSQLDKKTGTPLCQSSLNVANGRKSFPMTTLAALDNLSQIAAGFASGVVTLIKGDLIHDRGSRQRTIYESSEPVTGLEFSDVDGAVTLYVATTERILTFITSARGQIQPYRVLEYAGCALGCMTVNETSGDIVVAREDAIYFYGPNGRGPCFALEGSKSSVGIFKSYIAVVSPPQSQRRAGSSPGVMSSLRHLVNAHMEDPFETTSFTVLDPDLKFTAHVENLGSSVKTMFQEWGDLYLVTTDGDFLRYREKPLAEKLEILYQRNLYLLAVNLAQRSGVDHSRLNTIYRKHANYLYDKGDYDGSMQQYIRAIENTEPSQVIRKFLDTQRIHNLIEFLEELHRHPALASSDHTTLLLNCYAKLKDIDKLERFIKSDEGLKFDVETAIGMCRQGGYYDQAVFLAEKHDEYGIVIDILIENLARYQDALNYIKMLDVENAHSNLMKWAATLLREIPEDTTDLFIEYHTGGYAPLEKEARPSSAVHASRNHGAFHNYAAYFPIPYMGIPQANQANTDGEDHDAKAPKRKEFQPYVPKRARTSFSSFVDHPIQFARFLEECRKHGSAGSEEMDDLSTALFETYLSISSNDESGQRSEWIFRAKSLVEGADSSVDNSNVLLISHMSDFQEGTLLVKQKEGLFFDIFRSCTIVGDTKGAIKTLKLYGDREPQLYSAALSYITSNPRALDEAGEELINILEKIDKDGLMAPLEVIQILGSNATATMGMVKRYLSKIIERERLLIQSNHALIDNYQQESQSKRAEVQDLKAKPSVFHTTRCSACGGNLDLPTVHFLCKHSFHQRCLNVAADNAECPSCAVTNAAIRAIRRGQDESAERHDLFEVAVQSSRDKFSTISEFFGRGVMSTSN